MRIFRLFRSALLLTLFPLACDAQDAPTPPVKPAKYPLRLHVLVVDDSHPTVRIQPNWCSGTIPDFGGADLSAGGGAAPCSNNPGTLAFGGPDDFSGGGRADLVTPPMVTQGLSFNYEGCPRVRVPPGFQGLQARWKKPGKKLEVLIPTDDITENGRSAPTRRCTFTAVLHEFVYLRLRTGTILQVTQEGYWKKPALRMFLSGGTQTLQSRQIVTVQQLKQPPQ